MSIGKYLVNGGVIGSIVGLASTVKKTKHTPNDWRTVLTWVIWASTLAIAIGSVALRDQDRAYEELHKND
ncbi:hypothetical protein [Lysinibacter cavernae]|uniref:Uncharacterized protein n=1 Tax=Lysinibacter cavernae TaxID=1640652 RepID=A0A7X5R499_9MICO|nr:hypothetical protein [Lysinibacter cavernae]NIH55302.1 hypothetical protein [Lysinibacter cavernae]